MKQKSFWVLLMVFVVLLGGAYVLYDRMSWDAEPGQLAVQDGRGETAAAPDAGEGNSEEPPPEPVAAPDFTVYDRAGEEVRLSDYLGKPVVLNFWASWCGPCQSEMPDFDEVHGQLGEEIQFLMVNVTDGDRETVEKAAAFVEEQGYTFPVFFDSELSATQAYGAYSLPTTYFIDAEGFAVARAVGPINAETLQTGIDMLAPET